MSRSMTEMRPKFEEYSEKYADRIHMERRDGVIELRMHTDGGPVVWGLGMHRALSQAWHDVGNDPANAARMKLTVNFFLSGLLETMSETFVFAGKHGLDTETVQHLMINKAFPNPAVQEYAERIRTGYFDDAGATLITGLKDLTLILSEAADVRAPLPLADLVRDNILKSLARGEDQLDWCVSTRANRIAAGLD